MKINKGIYIMLCLFLGGIGVHKFYSGKYLMGFLYLVFCWTYIPVILSIFDVIGALLKSPESDGQIYI